MISITVKAGPNGADLNTILIELRRRFKLVQTRRFIQNNTYRLAQKSIIHAVPGRKGLYAASADDAKRLAPPMSGSTQSCRLASAKISSL